MCLIGGPLIRRNDVVTFGTSFLALLRLLNFPDTSLDHHMRHAWSFTLFALLTVGLNAEPYVCNMRGPRIRYPWSLLTPAQQALYLNAVADAMTQGYHQRFVEIHTESSSVNEAHGCMFIYWHRKFLLGYENMLRSLKPDYACLTIPYWDYATLSSQYVAQSCKNMYQCATDLINSFGGNVGKTALKSWQPINGNAVAGISCVRGFPLNNFCESTSAFDAGTCMHCVPRNNFLFSPVPPEINIVQVFSQVLGGSSTTDGKTLAEMSQEVQLGCHNSVHSALSGAMAHLEAPADPLFLLHHGTIDLMHTIYFKCNVADASTTRGHVPVMTDLQKSNVTDERIWTSCARLNGTTIRPTDPVRMVVGQRGSSYDSNYVLDVASPLYTFFQDLPVPYYQYADADDLGDFSYNYIYTGMLADMLTQCKNFIAPKTTAGTSPTAFLKQAADNPSYVDRCVDRPKLACEKKQASFLDYMSMKASQLGWTQNKLIAQVEAMVCVHHDECLGGVADYSDAFKASFHPKGPPRCKVIVDRLKAKHMFINLPNWRAVLSTYFPCSGTSL
ncbi:Aste57867_18771 [Aphanomyces stellatus]|uniref:Aste57867_18771 protein n=1 Tax=Aphanomyces stellatus TaxID=120398 RepID=A0A485LBT7_9STRA|nr:hypothetical protein As57867_018707 [Aphanomyces stellatus]VFT95505.1 Aste57867_18771 [Aphanomyces stellatus]